MSDELKITFEPYNEQAKQFVTDGIGNYNIATTGEETWYPVGLFLRTGEGEILGGLHGGIWGRWLYIKILWVSQIARGKGFGRKLMEAAKAQAVKRGCIGAHLETFSFQARPLYEKLGFEVFGEIKDYPPGHTFHFLRKRFDTEAR